MNLLLEHIDIEAVFIHGVSQSGEPVHFIFARHPEINPIKYHEQLRDSLLAAARTLPSEISELYERMYEKIGDLILSDPRTRTPLQAADLIAGEVYQWIPTPSGGLPPTLQPLTTPFMLRRIQW